MNTQNKRIAIVADWLIDFWWAELVISHLLEIFPDADIYTSVCYMDHPMLAWRKIYTSWLQKIPFFNRKHKLAGILRPWAFRSFDFSSYDIILSSSSAEAKNAGYSKRGKNTKHFCYCHTPTRYYWSHAKEYEDMMEFGIWNPFVKWVFRLMKSWMQRIDFAAAQKVDYFIANSDNTKERIEKYYNRNSEVIYPGINAHPLSFSEGESLSEKSQEILAMQGWQKNDSYYLWVGRCIPYKKFDLLVDTFNKNEKRLILCTATDTALFQELKKKSQPNIEWKFRVSNEEKYNLMKNAQAFLFPPEEDFWLVPVEAMMMGTPVIAYGKWGVLETVADGISGIFFSSQTPESVDEAIERFEKMEWDKEKIRKRGGEFSKEGFQKNIMKVIQETTV